MCSGSHICPRNRGRSRHRAPLPADAHRGRAAIPHAWPAALLHRPPFSSRACWAGRPARLGALLGTGRLRLGRRLALRWLGLTRRVRGLPRGLLPHTLSWSASRARSLRDPLPEPVLRPVPPPRPPPNHGTRPAPRPVSSAFPRAARTGPPPPPAAHPGGPQGTVPEGLCGIGVQGQEALAQPGLLGSLCGERRAAIVRSPGRPAPRPEIDGEPGQCPDNQDGQEDAQQPARRARRDHASRRRWSRYHWSRYHGLGRGGTVAPEREHRLSVHHIDRLIAGIRQGLSQCGPESGLASGTG